jgi:diguanylate cyclase (GGDEF)-like protein
MTGTERQYLDELSGAFNRRYLSEVLEPELKAQIDRRSCFSLVMVDIDRFKEINDLFGHLHGDQVIREFSAYLRSCIRPSDRVVRYGGDEFLCYMQGIGRNDAERIYQRILERCRFRKMAGHSITISVGIAEHPKDAAGVDDLIKLADESLYDAKRRGRDRLGAVRSRHLEVPIKAFVDRSREKELLSLYLMAAEGRAKVVLVRGAVGIGKTRLVREVLNRISYREVLWADCLALDEAISYHCIRQLLSYKLRRRGEQLLGELPPAFQVEIVKLLPELARAQDSQADRIGPVLDKYRLYEGVRLFIEQGEIRKILVVDNIQWMDRESPGVLRYLMRALRDRDIAFVLICRSEEMGPEWQEFVAGVGRELELYEVELGHFDTASIRESVGLALGEEPGDRLANFVIKKSGGNPYFIEEILRELHLREHLTVDREVWSFREPEEMTVPRKVADVIHQKYERLSPEARSILAAASVAGSFDREIIEEITGFNPGHVEGLLDEITRLGLAGGERSRLMFREEICQQAIYQKWAQGEQARKAHLRVADILERRHRGRLAGVIDELAFHCRRAMDHKRGIAYCLKAAEKAELAYSNWDARRYYGWAMDLLKEAGVSEQDERMWNARLKSLEMEFRIGDPQKLMAEYDWLLRQAREQRNSSRQAEVLFRTAMVMSYSLSQHRKALPPARRAYEIFKRLGNRQAMAGALNLLGVIYRNLGQYGRSAESLRHSVSLKTGTGSTGQAWTNLGNLAFSRGRLDEARRYFARALKVFQARGDRVNQALVQGNLSVLARVQGDMPRAMDLLQRSLSLKRLVGDRRGEALSLVSLGNIHTDQDQFAQALECYRTAVKINAEVPQKGLGMLAARNMGLVYRGLGQFNKAMECMQQALALAEEAGDRESRQLILNAMGDVHLNLGHLAQARQSFAAAARSTIAPNLPSQYLLAISLTTYHLEAGELGKARKAIRKAYRHCKTIHSKFMACLVSQLSAELWLEQGRPREAWRELGKTKKFLPARQGSHQGQYNLLAGRAEMMLGRCDQAHRLMKLAREIFRSLGMRLQEGMANHWLGVLQSLCGQRESSAGFLEEAFAIFESIEAGLWKERAQRELKKLGSGGR